MTTVSHRCGQQERRQHIRLRHHTLSLHCGLMKVRTTRQSCLLLRRYSIRRRSQIFRKRQANSCCLTSSKVYNIDTKKAKAPFFRRPLFFALERLSYAVSFHSPASRISMVATAPRGSQCESNTINARIPINLRIWLKIIRISPHLRRLRRLSNCKTAIWCMRLP